MSARLLMQYFEDVSQPYKTPVAGARGRATAFAVNSCFNRTSSPNPVPNAWSRRVFPSVGADDAGTGALANPSVISNPDPRRAPAPAVRSILRSSSSLSRALAASSSAAAAAAAAAGAGPNRNPATTANPAFRLAAVPAGGDTGVRPAARFVLPGTEPRRTADVPVRSYKCNVANPCICMQQVVGKLHVHLSAVHEHEQSAQTFCCKKRKRRARASLATRKQEWPLLILACITSNLKPG